MQYCLRSPPGASKMAPLLMAPEVYISHYNDTSVSSDRKECRLDKAKRDDAHQAELQDKPL